MSPSCSPIEKVHMLYEKQADLCKILDSDLGRPEERKEAQKHLRDFKRLLREADWRYTGGEDVKNSFYALSEQVHAKLERTMQEQSLAA